MTAPEPDHVSSRRRRPWWQWVLIAFAALFVSPRVQWRLPCVASSGELAWWLA